MKKKTIEIIQLIVINILWSMFIFGAVFFINWSTDLSVLRTEERGIMVGLIAIVFMFSLFSFFSFPLFFSLTKVQELTTSKEKGKYPIWFVTEEEAKKLRELHFEDFEIVINPQIEECNKNKEEELAFLKKYSLKSIYSYEQILEWFKGQQYIGIVEDRKDKGFSYKILGLRKTISDFYKTYEEAREALIKEMINIYEIKNPKK